jgi:hypothetical protein
MSDLQDPVQPEEVPAAFTQGDESKGEAPKPTKKVDDEHLQ